MIRGKTKINSFKKVLESHSRVDSLNWKIDDLGCLVVDPFIPFRKLKKLPHAERKADRFLLKREAKISRDNFPFD